MRSIIYRGTLILATFCREGLVICADKRAFAEHQGTVTIRDDQQKIIQPTTNIPLFFGATGTSKILDSDAPSTSFDAIKTIDKFAKREGAVASPLDYFTKAGEEIKKAFCHHLDTHNFQDWPDEGPDNEPLHLFSFYPDPTGQISIVRVVLVYFKGPPAKVAVSKPGLVAFDGLFTGFGDFETGKLLLNEAEPTLSALRHDPLISLFLSRHTTPDMVSCEQAIEFSRKLIEISSSTGPTQGQVSTTSECVVLRGKTASTFRLKNK